MILYIFKHNKYIIYMNLKINNLKLLKKLINYALDNIDANDANDANIDSNNKNSNIDANNKNSNIDTNINNDELFEIIINTVDKLDIIDNQLIKFICNTSENITSNIINDLKNHFNKKKINIDLNIFDYSKILLYNKKPNKIKLLKAFENNLYFY